MRTQEMTILEALELAVSALQNELNRADPEGKLLGRSREVDNLSHAALIVADHLNMVSGIAAQLSDLDWERAIRHGVRVNAYARAAGALCFFLSEAIYALPVDQQEAFLAKFEQRLTGKK